MERGLSRIILILIALGFLLVGCAPPEEEPFGPSGPNGVNGPVTPVNVNMVVNEWIPGYGSKSFSFFASNSGTYTVYLFGASRTNPNPSIESYTNTGSFWCWSMSCEINNVNGGETVEFTINEEDGMDLTFSLIVTQGLGDEGAVGNPLSISPGTVLNTKFGNKGYYSFVPSADGSYNITLSSSTQNLSWRLFSDSGFASQVGWTCDDNYDTGLEKCLSEALTAYNTYYLEVDANSTYGDLSITVDASPTLGASSASPQLVSVGMATTANTNNDSSYLKFTAGANANYRIKLENASEDLKWTLYSDAAYSVFVNSCDVNGSYGLNGIAEECVSDALSAGTEYFLKVYCWSCSDDVVYTVTITEETPVSGSINSPINLTMNQSNTSTVDGYGNLYFSFNTGTFSGISDISLMSVTHDVNWRLYSDPGYTTQIGWCNTITGSGTELCSTISLNSYTTYYVKVYNFGSFSDDVTINVMVASGTLDNPQVMTQGNPYYGTLDNSGIFMSFQNGLWGPVDISVNGGVTNLVWELFDDAAFTNQITYCNNTSFGTETCTTPNLLKNGTYYLKVYCAAYCTSISFDVTVPQVQIIPLTPGNPLITTFPVDAGNSWSYFSFNNNLAGQISITGSSNTNDISWELYSTSSFDLADQIGNSCDNIYTIGTESCSTDPLNFGPYYLKVKCWGACTAADLSVTVGNSGLLGMTAGNPQHLLMDTPATGYLYQGIHYADFQGDGASKYMIFAGDSNKDYKWNFSQWDWNWTFNPNDGWFCNFTTGSGQEICNVPTTSPSGVHYLRTEYVGTTASKKNGEFPLTVYSMKGWEKANRLMLQNNAGSFGYNIFYNNMEFAYNSYGQFISANSGSATIIVSTNSGKDLMWSVYTDASYLNLVTSCDNVWPGAGTETCMTAPLTIDATHYLRVYCKDCTSENFVDYNVTITQ